MRVELLPGMSNVVRFPVERRAHPTPELLREIAPDVRVVLNLAEAFGMEAPMFDLRERTDAATAEHILNQAPAAGARREAMLCDLEAPVIARAVSACREAHDAWGEAAEARQVLHRAQTAGQFWLDPLRERAEQLTERAAVLVLQAHAWAEEAEGVARAVGIARRGEAWRPSDHEAETDELIRMGRLAAG